MTKGSGHMLPFRADRTYLSSKATLTSKNERIDKRALYRQEFKSTEWAWWTPSRIHGRQQVTGYSPRRKFREVTSHDLEHF